MIGKLDCWILQNCEKCYIFRYITLYLWRKRETSSMWTTFSNISLVSVLKWCSLMITRALYSTSTFNGVRCLACQTLWWLSLLEYKRMSETCVANPQLRYNNLFLSWFSEGWFTFSQSGFYLEEFVVNVVILVLLPFCKKEFIDLAFQLKIWNKDIVGAQIYGRFGCRVCSFISVPFDVAWDPTHYFFMTRHWV